MPASLWTDRQAGPASYTGGGFTVVTTLTTVASFDAWIDTAGPNLGAVSFEFILNSPSAGSVKVKVLQEKFNLLDSLGGPTGLPAGVTSPASSGSNVATETPHSHAIDHDHPIVTSGLLSGGLGTVTQALLNAVNSSTHTHTVDLALLTGTSGTQTHQHTWNNIYAHAHTVTQSTVDVGLTQIIGGTNLSGALLNYIASDA